MSCQQLQHRQIGGQEGSRLPFSQQPAGCPPLTRQHSRNEQCTCIAEACGPHAGEFGVTGCCCTSVLHWVVPIADDEHKLPDSQVRKATMASLCSATPAACRPTTHPAQAHLAQHAPAFGTRRSGPPSFRSSGRSPANKSVLLSCVQVGGEGGAGGSGAGAAAGGGGGGEGAGEAAGAGAGSGGAGEEAGEPGERRGEGEAAGAGVMAAGGGEGCAASGGASGEGGTASAAACCSPAAFEGEQRPQVARQKPPSSIQLSPHLPQTCGQQEGG